MSGRRKAHLTPARFAAALGALAAFVAGAAAFGVAVGSVDVFALEDREQAATILREFRLPRVLLAGLVAISVGLDLPLFGISPVSAAAFGGACGALALVFAIARRGGRLPPHTLLLAGVIVNSIFSAVILFINYLASIEHSQRIVRWLMGGIDWERLGTVARAAPLVLLGSAGLCALARPLNLLSLGEEPARALGVPVERVRLLLFLLTSLVTGVAVSVSGPIAFVGLIVPHALRFLIGADHRLLLPGSFLGGAGFLIVGDTAARSVLASQEIPVGVVMALVGGPFFIALLRRSLRGAHFG
jgi:iron complex transport system permease protein